MSSELPLILLIEDDLAIAKLIEFKLKRNGYRFEVRNNGTEGLTAIKELNPDLVVLDVMLPSMNGFELLRQIRSDSDIDQTKVIMLTATVRVKDKEKAFNLGVEDYMEKPFKADELIIRVNKALKL